MANLAARWKHYDPENPRMVRRIGPETWEALREPICRLHHEGWTKQDILTWLSTEFVHEIQGPIPTMNQLVRQMKVWGLRAGTRHPSQLLPANSDALSHGIDLAGISIPDVEITDVYELTLNFQGSKDENPDYESLNTEMVNSGDTPQLPTTMSDLHQQSGILGPGPMVIDSESPTSAPVPVDDLSTHMTLTDSASDTSSMLSIVRKLAPRAVRPQKTSSDEMSDRSSTKSFFTFSTHSSWSFGRVTGLAPLEAHSAEPDRLYSTAKFRKLTFSEHVAQLRARNSTDSNSNTLPRSMLDFIKEISVPQPPTPYNVQTTFYCQGRVFERLIGGERLPFLLVRHDHKSLTFIRIHEDLPHASRRRPLQTLLALRYERAPAGDFVDPDSGPIRTLYVMAEGWQSEDMPSLIGFADLANPLEPLELPANGEDRNLGMIVDLSSLILIIREAKDSIIQNNMAREGLPPYSRD